MSEKGSQDFPETKEFSSAEMEAARLGDNEYHVSPEDETRRIVRPDHPSFTDSGKLRRHMMRTLMQGTSPGESQVSKSGKAHEVRYDFCVDSTLDHLKTIDRYRRILMPQVLERVKQISLSVLPIVIGQILEKYKKIGLKEGDLQIDDQGRITIPDKKIVRVRKRRIPFSARSKKGKAKSVLKLDEEIRSRYLSVARMPLRQLAKQVAQDLQIPRELVEKFANRYLILGKVRENGPCQMFLAKDVNTNELVALKVFLYVNDEIRKRYLQEMMTLEMLQGNERVPAFKDADETEEAGFLSMEWIDGVDVKHYLNIQGGFLPLSAQVNEDGEMEKIGVMELAIQLASILHQCHTDSPCVIHRDVSESNVMINNDLEVVLTDFGLSACKTAPGKLAPMKGYTPAYASPEAIEERPFDEKSDVYSFAALVYKLITGRLPHEGSGSTSTEVSTRIMVQRMRKVDPPHILDLRPETPEELADLVMQCLSYEPEDRPPWAEILQLLLGVYELHFEKDVEETDEEFIYSSELLEVA